MPAWNLWTTGSFVLNLCLIKVSYLYFYFIVISISHFNDRKEIIVYEYKSTPEEQNLNSFVLPNISNSSLGMKNIFIVFIVEKLLYLPSQSFFSEKVIHT